MAASRVVTTVEELKSLVGEDFGAGAWYEVTQDKVNLFADATGDHQFIHVDPERAAKTPFGGTVAHGYMTLSLLPMLAQNRDGIEVQIPRKMAVNYGSNRVRFVSPVRVGKRIRARSKLLSVEDVAPGVIQTTFQQTIEIEGEERPAMVAETIGRLYL
jgi:acyl dehydratase